MRLFLDQIGCRLNYSEMDTLAQRLRAIGHQTVDRPEQAQVVVFNTCAVTAQAGRKSRQRIHQLHRANPEARIALTGCWATLKPQQAAKLPGVMLVADNIEKDLLHTLLEPWSAELDNPADLMRLQPDGTPFHATISFAESDSEPHAGALPEAQDRLEPRRPRTRAFVKVQDGCNNKCTFCVVTLARGHSRSRTLHELVSEVQALAQDGVQEAVLTGVHLGSYGRDLSGDAHTDLKELTAAILRHTDIRRLRLSSLEPWELADGFFELWRQWPDRLCPHLHLPLQSGSDRQLRRMARRCTVDSFRQLVADARAAIPDLVITTDLIVGFPGESEGDFEQSMAFVEEMRFAHAHIFPFSARTGTAAATFAQQLPKAVKQARSLRMRALVEQTGRLERQRFVNTVRPVLWESSPGEVDGANHANLDRLWVGYTDNYLRVTTEAPPEVDLANQLLPVRLNELYGDTLFGVCI